MSDTHFTDTTEVIPDEDWCTECKHPVREWNVSFENNSEGDYEKIRRCPHCEAKCFADGSCELTGCLFAFLGFYVFPLLGYACLNRIGFKVDAEDGGPFWIIWIASIVLAIFLYSVLCSLWKSWLYRHKRSYERRHREKQIAER